MELNVNRLIHSLFINRQLQVIKASENTHSSLLPLKAHKQNEADTDETTCWSGGKVFLRDHESGIITAGGSARMKSKVKVESLLAACKQLESEFNVRRGPRFVKFPIKASALSSVEPVQNSEPDKDCSNRNKPSFERL